MEKLIRFDWAIKKILRDKANFNILEGFLSALLGEEIRVRRLLESEGNQQEERDKYNRVDLLVENSNGELVLIEVQVESENDFFHRIAFGAAKLLTEYLKVGEPYANLKKVYSVSLLYFNLGQGSDYLYHGATRFVGVHDQDVLGLSQGQQKLFNLDQVAEIFPEYYLIQVEKFPDEVRTAVDEWIYMLKHSEVKPEFRAKHIQEASAKLRAMNLSEEQRRAYERYLDDLHYQASMEWSARVDGYAAATRMVIKNGLQQGLDRQTLAALTGLTLVEIQGIQAEEA